METQYTVNDVGLTVIAATKADREREMNRDGLANFVLGLGIGVALGVLFAPKSGEETRELLRAKADEGKDFLKQQASEMRYSAGDLVEKGREAMGRQRDVLADAIDAGKQAYRDKVENISSQTA